jgi:hypothetical protein
MPPLAQVRHPEDPVGFKRRRNTRQGSDGDKQEKGKDERDRKKSLACERILAEVRFDRCQKNEHEA